MAERIQIRRGGAVERVYLTDAEIAASFGMSAADWKARAPLLEREGLPMQDPAFGNRRYWPAVRLWLDARNGVGPDSALRSTAREARVRARENWT